MSRVIKASQLSCGAAMVCVVAMFGSIYGANAQTAKTPEFTTEGFLNAAHDSCAVEGRSPRACKCEQLLINGDHLSEDDKQMAYYFWTDKKEYGKRYIAKNKKDPKWKVAFSERFTNLQALVMSSCGK